MTSVTSALLEAIEVNALYADQEPRLPVLQSDDYDRNDSVQVALQRDVSKVIATENGHTVGALSYSFQDAHAVTPYDAHRLDGRVLYVHDLGSVAPGAGTAMMRQIEQMARQEDVPVILAYTASSRSFYQKLGYCCLQGLAWKEISELSESLLNGSCGVQS